MIPELSTNNTAFTCWYAAAEGTIPSQHKKMHKGQSDSMGKQYINFREEMSTQSGKNISIKVFLLRVDTQNKKMGERTWHYNLFF